MKFEMFEFMLRSAGFELGIDYNPFNPYTHIGAPEAISRFHRPFGPGYSMHPELTRPTRAFGLAKFYHSGFAPAVAGAAGLAVPAYLMATATAVYPTVAGPQYQSSASGQVGIGSSALSIEPAGSWKELFSWSYWSS